MTKMCNINHIFLNYMNTLLEIIYYILVVSITKTLVL